MKVHKAILKDKGWQPVCDPNNTDPYRQLVLVDDLRKVTCKTCLKKLAKPEN